MLAEFGEFSHGDLSWDTMKPVFVNGKWRFIPPDDPLFVVHFGLGQYHPEGRGMVPSQEEYARYKLSCLEKIASAVAEGRTVIFFTPEEYLYPQSVFSRPNILRNCSAYPTKSNFGNFLARFLLKEKLLANLLTTVSGTFATY